MQERQEPKILPALGRFDVTIRLSGMASKAGSLVHPYTQPPVA